MAEGPFADIVEAFNSDDDDRRVELLRRRLTDDAEVVHPHGEAIGPAAFSADIGSIRQGFPGLTGRLDGHAESLHRWDRQAWTLVDADGAVFATGSYTARRTDDGRFSHLVSMPDAHA